MTTPLLSGRWHTQRNQRAERQAATAARTLHAEKIRAIVRARLDHWAQASEMEIKAEMDRRLAAYWQRKGRTMIAALWLLLVASAAQAQGPTTQTFALPFQPTNTINWTHSADDYARTDEYLLQVDGTRVSLGKPGVFNGTVSVAVPPAVVALLGVGTHTLIIVAKNTAGEAPSQPTLLTITAAGPPPLQPPGPTSPPLIMITITVVK